MVSQRYVAEGSLAPYRGVTTLSGYPRTITPQVEGHSAAVLSQWPPVAWLFIAVAAALLIAMVVTTAVRSSDPGQRQDAIEVLSLVFRVVRPGAFPGKERRRPRRRRRQQAPGMIPSPRERSTRPARLGRRRARNRASDRR